MGLWVLSFGMLPAVLIPGPVQEQMRNLIEVGLLGMAGLLAARAFFDEKFSISDLILPWASFIAAWLILWIVAFMRGYVIEQYTFAIPDARKHFGWFMLVVAAFIERQRPWRLHSIVVAIASILSVELLIQAALPHGCDRAGDEQHGCQVRIRHLGFVASAASSTPPSRCSATCSATAETRLVHASLHDALTGLPNRVYLTEQLQQRLSPSSLTLANCGQ